MGANENFDWQARIKIDPAIMGGMPVIAGTRVAVQYILEALAAGASFDEVREEFLITEEDVRAALAYAVYSLERAGAHAIPGR